MTLTAPKSKSILHDAEILVQEKARSYCQDEFRSLSGNAMDKLFSVQQHFAGINKAAGEYLTKLILTDIKKDIVLAAEMAGLMLLRNSGADLHDMPSGVGLLGAISDDVSKTMNRFVFGWAASNGLNPRELDFAAILRMTKGIFQN